MYSNCLMALMGILPWILQVPGLNLALVIFPPGRGQKITFDTAMPHFGLQLWYPSGPILDFCPYRDEDVKDHDWIILFCGFWRVRPYAYWIQKHEFITYKF